MPMIDPGITLIGDDGAATLSPQAIRLPLPPQINPNVPSSIPNAPQAMQGNINQIAPTPASLGQGSELPKISTADSNYFSDKYKDVASHPMGYDSISQARQELQPHGVRRVLNALAGIATLNPTAALSIYDKLQQRPFQKAEQDWAGQLESLRPGIQFEESQMREKGERERAEGTLAETKRLRSVEEQRADEQRRKDESEAKDRAAKLAEKTQQDKALNKIKQDVQNRLANKPLPVQEMAFQLYSKKARGEILSPTEESQIKALDQIKKEKEEIAQAGAEARGKAYGEYRPVQTVNPDGTVSWDFAGHAIGTGAKSTASVPFQVLRGQALAGLPTATIRTMAQRAASVEPHMQSAVDKIDNLESEIGPIAGRWNDFWVNKAGINDPAYAALDTDLTLIASGLALAHNLPHDAYVKKMMEHFHQAQSPDDLKARIAEADVWMLGYKGMVPKVNLPDIPPSPPKPNVQNPKKPKHDLSGVQ